jgi:hypothetical protein
MIPAILGEAEGRFRADHEAGERVHHPGIGQFSVGFEVIGRDFDVFAARPPMEQRTG